jgi:hypothetical protein
VTLTATDIQTLIDALPARMSDKGLRVPRAALEFRAGAVPGVSLEWRRGPSSTYRWFPAATAQEALDAAVNFIAALPAAE